MSRKLFSLAVEESKYFGDHQPKIEVINFPEDQEEGGKQLSVINQYFLESGRFHLDMDYQRAIEALKQAFDVSLEINESGVKYAEKVRSTIILSLENIHSDLRQMTSGWLKAKRFQSSFELATVVLNECRMKQTGLSI